MNLLELYEDIFLEICDLNRIGRSGGTKDYNTVRADLEARLQAVKAKAKTDPTLEAQVEKLELPVIFFIDSMMVESKLGFARQWNQHRLAFDHNQRAGDQKFFELLEETLNDPRADAPERLAIFYQCLGLGFTGIHAGKPEYLKSLMSRMAEKIGALKEFDPNARICQPAYDSVDTQNLIEPPSRKMIVLALVFVCFALAAAFSYVWMFKVASRELSESVNAILQVE